MDLKNSLILSLFITLFSLPTWLVAADTPEPELSANLDLKLPFIRFHPTVGSDLFYQANMVFLPTGDGRLLFEVTDHKLLQASEITRQPQLKTLANVIAGSPPQIILNSSKEATLLFTSSIPLACSVVYGTSPEFGSIAVDQDMNGGAHSDHSPILSGLQADTLYYYRVQGTAANGIIYWGDTATFQTPAENTNAPTNLASIQAGANIKNVSSNFGNAMDGGNWGAESAIDESSASEWSSNGDGDNAFIEITLAQRSQINSIGVWSRSMMDGSAKIFSFSITTDNGTVLGPFTLPDTTKMHDFAVNIEASSLRLDVVTSSGGNTGLVEFAAY